MGGPNSGRRPAPSSQQALRGNPGKRKSAVTETAFPDGEPEMPSTLGPAGVAGEGDVRYEREFDYLTRLDLLQPGELEAIQQKGA